MASHQAGYPIASQERQFHLPVTPLASRAVSRPGSPSASFSGEVFPGDAAWSAAPSLPESQAHALAALLHDARSMVASMDLYCDLLQAPGVLSASSRQYASDLRLVAGTGRRLLDRLAALVHSPLPPVLPAHDRGLQASRSPSLFPPSSIALGHSRTVANLAAELCDSHRLLSALAGPSVKLAIRCTGGACPVPIAVDDLTRVLVNLVRNAAEAMPGGGRIEIALVESAGSVTLSVADDGPGIPPDRLEAVFAAGFTSRWEPEAMAAASSASSAHPPLWPVRHRGLGLSIVRSIVTAAGGVVWAANRRDSCPTPLPEPPLPSAGLVSAQPDARSRESSPAALGGAVLYLEFPVPAPAHAT